jgi:hypothetical protein
MYFCSVAAKLRGFLPVYGFQAVSYLYILVPPKKKEKKKSNVAWKSYSKTALNNTSKHPAKAPLPVLIWIWCENR